MTITIEKSLLNNQSILQNFALVEEIDEQVAGIISGGQSSNKEIYAFEGEVDPEESNPLGDNLAFGAQRRWRRRDGDRNRDRNRYC